MQSAYPLTRHFTKLVNTSTECLPRIVVTETVNVPLEIWMTFTFTLVIAAFLVGGGIYLVYHGTTNNVTDFIVLGSCGSVVGFCFASVAMIILYKSICGSRKQTSWKNTLTLVPRKQNSMSHNAQAPTRKQKPEITNHLTNNGTCIEGSKRKPVSIKAKNAAAETVKAAPSCDTTNSKQPIILIHTDHRKESTLMDNNSLLFNQEARKKEQSSPDQTHPRFLVLPRHTSMASLSSQSTFSGMSSDSVQTFEETVTVVVAEVHAQPSHTRDSFEYTDERHVDGQPIYISSPPISLSVSCENNMFESLEDLSSDDSSSSRPNSSIGELMSEEEIPFAYYGEDIIYRLNNSDTENCDESIATLLINDPLIYGHTSDARNGYILNKCHMITEVLVHSG